MVDQHLTDTKFHNLGLPQVLLQAVDAAGFQYCTPIQAQTLPVALNRGDVAGQAQTGTGKTAAFLLAMYHHLLRCDSQNPSSLVETGHAEISESADGPRVQSTPEQFADSTKAREVGQPRAVIIAPTRELAVQIHKDAAQLGQYTAYRLGLVFGGTGYESQRRQLESGVDILIGTPGRMIDYHKQRVFDFKSVQVMILDEADRMFDLGFIKDIRFILRRMPAPDQRLNMLFSATLSYRVTELAYEHMNNPQFIRIEPDKRTVDKVEQLLYHVAIDEKTALLVGLLRRTDPTRSLVFVNTKDAGEYLVAQIQGNGLAAEVLSGDVPQKTRLRLLQDFIEGRLPILVATDVAARGLHIPDVSHVFNFDLPQNAEDYVHRIGRTARAGKSGDAISFACERYVFSLMEIEAYIGHKIPVAPVTPELLAELAPLAPHARPHGRRSRRRGGESRRGGAGRAPASRRAAPQIVPDHNKASKPTAPAASKSAATAGPEKSKKGRTPDTQKRAARTPHDHKDRVRKVDVAARPRRPASDKPVIG